jgi:transposase InsO family protein
VSFTFIATQAQRWPVRPLCRLLGVSASGYYAWLARGISRQAWANLDLCQLIARLFFRYRGRYGAPRIWAELRRRGVVCSRNRIARLMRRMQLCGIKRKKQSQRRPPLDAAVNLLQREFAPGWRLAVCADITEIKTRQGKRYLAAVLCLPTRRILGWSSGNHASSVLAQQALDLALSGRNLGRWLHHSDRGSAYTSADYLEQLGQAGLIASFSKPGDCYDNSVMESFFATLKRELRFDKQRPDALELPGLLGTYIEGFYNRERLHSSLGYQSPEMYAKMHLVA